MSKRSILITCLTFVFFTLNARAETVTKKFDTASLESLELRNPTGKIRVKGTDDEQSMVKVEKIKMNEDCALVIEQKGKTLIVDIHSSAWLKSVKCHADIEASIPKQASIDLKSASGDVEIKDITGKVKFLSGSGDVRIAESQIPDLDGKVGSGNIHIDGTIQRSELKSGSGNLKIKGKIGLADLKCGSGNIEIEGLTDSADILTGSGNISLKYSEVKESGELKIKSGSGDATVYMPRDSKISTNFFSGSGKVQSEFEEVQDPTFNVTFKAGSGNLRIRKLR